jgi:TrkA domain protein
MRDEVSQQDLPGIGRRFDVEGQDGGRVSVVMHHSGRCDVYARARGDAEPTTVSFTDDQARRLGAVMAGAYFKPAAVQRIEAVIGDLLVDWVTVPDNSPVDGRSIGELGVRRETRMTIAAIVREGTTIVAPDPDEAVRVGDKLVVLGPPAALPALQALVGADP